VTGSDASAFVAKLTKETDEGRKWLRAKTKSTNRMLMKGYQPHGTEIMVAVQRRDDRPAPQSLLGQLVEKIIPSLLAQESYIDEGYGIWTNWDDADDSTWEGNIYVFKYGPEWAMNIDMQIDIDSIADEYTEYDVDWAAGEYYPGEGEGGGGGEIEMKHLMSALPRMLTVATAAQQPQCPCNQLQQICPGGGTCYLKCMAKKIAKNSVPVCGGGWFGSRWACRGPQFWLCVGGTCLAAAVASTISAVIDLHTECWGAAPAAGSQTACRLLAQAAGTTP
jgi:hypothetical protein